ncbi:UPF0481 protein At3g47200-like [Juglans regia]|uniref:UPF0481 protein At3g47200-like n=1 Tax=Juglans regia TaxID=51240 RepID=A0A6P9END3_JUGRE|nr:UPF0481 protein At3g47200-like [Juglans regia]XP_035550131.1 UPF0481 protein At3g47200-like [Juglans regia]
MAASHSASTSNPPQQHSPSRNPDPPISSDSNRSNQTCAETRDVEELESSIREKLFQTYLPPPSHCSIFRVPNMLRSHNEKAFLPEVVSIGPFHRENEQLQSMEITKLRYLKCLLYRTGTTELKSLVEAIQSIEQDCREYYAEVVDLGSKKFIEMMLIDGCFILEFLYRYKARYFGEISMELKEGEDDPMFKTSWMQRKIVADLLLLENQLPWCVLVCLLKLFNSTTTEYGNSRLVDLVACPFLEYRMFGERNRINSPSGTLPHKHLLDCFRAQLVESCGPIETLLPLPYTWKESLMWKSISSVTELLDFEIGFFAATVRDSCILDVKFEDGKMKIPEIFIEENTESLFRNLIAFEHCDPSMGTQVTSYAAILGCLIKSPADALHLKQRHILHIGWSNELDDQASFLNRLIYDNHTCFPGFHYSDLCLRLNGHQSRRFNVYQATLRRDYFKDPTTFFTLVYGIAFMLFLGILQTIFAILSYYKDQ